MEACGIEETYVESNCKDSQRCTVIDVWIHGINDKPLTIAECGEYFVSVDYKYNRWCNPVCGNKTIAALLIVYNSTDGSRLTPQTSMMMEITETRIEKV